MAKGRRGNRDLGKESKWLERIRRWEASGLGQRAFCRKHGYREVRFYWWKRVLQERGKWKSAKPPRRRKHSVEAGSPPFAQIQIGPSHRSAVNTGYVPLPTGGMIQIDIGDQYRIRVPNGFDPHALERILTVLEARTC